MLSASLGRAGGVVAAAKAYGTRAALPVPELKVKPSLPRSVCPLFKIRFWWSLPAGSCWVRGWCPSLFLGKLVVSVSGHNEGDAIGVELLEGLVVVPSGTTTPVLGTNPWFFLRRRWRCGVVPLLGGTVLGTTLVVVEL
jgi:hypothetical protein